MICESTGKTSYLSKAAARLHAASKSKRRIRVYRCELCKRWHVTSNMQMSGGFMGDSQK